MNWAIGIAILLICLLLYANFANRRREKQLLQKLKEGWGKPKTDNYFNFSLIVRYFENRTENDAVFQIIAPQTAKDLDFEALFKFLDRTTSKVGQQFLYKKLRMLVSKKELSCFSSLVRLYQNNKQLRWAAQKQLSRLSSADAYDLEFLTRKHSLQPKPYKNLLYFSTLGVIAFLILGIFYPFFFVLLLPLFIVNSVFHYSNKAKLMYYLNGITQLAIAYEVAKGLAESKEVVKVRSANFLKDIRQIRAKIVLVGFEKRLDSELAQLAWLVTELLKILFNFEVLLFYRLEKDLVAKREAILQLFDFIGNIDAAIAVASLRAGDLPTCAPVFEESKNIATTQMLHPLVENCVPNDFTLDGRSLLLTGSNMSGKTTFIKTLSVNSLLSQTLGFCYAESYVAPFMRIQTSIKVTDDLLADTSYYLQEVLNVKSFIEASREGVYSLFVLDELFKGTNTVERIAAGKAVLSYLNNTKSIVLVSTHDIELANLLEKDGYQLHCFDEKVQDEQIHFSYKIKEGIPQQRNAIKILALYGYPEELVAEARLLS